MAPATSSGKDALSQCWLESHITGIECVRWTWLRAEETSHIELIQPQSVQGRQKRDIEKMLEFSTGLRNKNNARKREVWRVEKYLTEIQRKDSGSEPLGEGDGSQDWSQGSCSRDIPLGKSVCPGNTRCSLSASWCTFVT